MSEWLELELAHRLAPAPAPERLWQLVERPDPDAKVRRRPVKTVLLLAAAVAASAWVAAVWRPEARSVRMAGLSVSPVESHGGCRACHTD